MCSKKSDLQAQKNINWKLFLLEAFLAGGILFGFLSYAFFYDLKSDQSYMNNKLDSLLLSYFAPTKKHINFNEYLGLLEHLNEQMPILHFIRLYDDDEKLVFSFLPKQWKYGAYAFQEAFSTAKPVPNGIDIKIGDRSFAVKNITVYKKYKLEIGIANAFYKHESASKRTFFRQILLAMAFVFLVVILYVRYVVIVPIRDFRQQLDLISQTRDVSRRIKLSYQYDTRVVIATERINIVLDKLEELFQGLKRNLSNISHDLKTPLSILQAKLEKQLILFNDREKETQTKEEGPIEQILLESLETLAFINTMFDNILEVTATEYSLVTFTPTHFNLSSFLVELHEFYQILADEKDIQIKLQIVEDVFIDSDAIKLNQALGNLLDNAIKFSPPNTDIDFTLKQVEDRVEISIANLGPSIPVEKQALIWQKLYRDEQSRSSPGYGLGLSIVEVNTKFIQGRVRVDSPYKDDIGAVFTISLKNVL